MANKNPSYRKKGPGRTHWQGGEEHSGASFDQMKKRQVRKNKKQNAIREIAARSGEYK